MKQWLALLLLLGCSCAAFADMTIVQHIKTSPMMGQPGKDTEMTMYIKGQKARMQTKDTANYQLMDLQSNKMFIVDPTKKQVMVVNPDTMEAASKMFSQMNGGKEPKIDVQKTGKSDTVSGYKCEEYAITASGGMLSMNSIQCVTKEVNTAEFEPFRKYAEGVMKMIGGAKGNIDIKGLPVRNAMKLSLMGQTMDSMTEVLSVSTSTISDDMFSYPPDYKAVDMPSMPQQQPHP